LNVPIAFHTELMEPTLKAWRASLAEVNFAPPRVPLISSVTNKYVADPDDIRDNLALQMVTPVRYVDLVQRFAHTGLDAILEVGPQQVLTRLHRRTLATGGIVCTALDHPDRPPQEQLKRLFAQLECLGWTPQANRPIRLSSASVNGDDGFGGPSFQHQATRTCHPIEQFDATVARRSRRQNQSRTNFSQKPDEPVPLFDATQGRVDRRNGHAADPSPAPAANPRPLPNSNGKQVAVKSGSDSLDQILLTFVMEQTGYPADLINFDWDLEADLGIDSIKRAQLFGELRQSRCGKVVGRSRALASPETASHYRGSIRGIPKAS
jgi:acyl transferase domain-containing protein